MAATFPVWNGRRRVQMRKSWLHSASNPPVASDYLLELDGVVLKLVFKSATCSAAAPAKFDAMAKQVMIELGDVAALFDAQGKAIAAKCNAQ